MVPLQENWAIALGFLRQLRKLPLYVTYCGVSLDRRNRASLLWRTIAMLYKPPQYTCFSGIRHSYSGAL